MSPRAKERRKYQRISVLEPVVGRFGTNKILVTDIAIHGASIESRTQLKSGEQTRLTFTWDGEEVSLEARVIRCKLRGFSEDDRSPVYHSGLLFVEAIGESAQLVRKMIAAYIARALAEQKANARGVPPTDLSIPQADLVGVDLGGFAKLLSSRTFTAPSRYKKGSGLIAFRYNKGTWTRSKTQDPTQPMDGFTLSESESGEQEELLCRTYERVDESWQRLIRLLAEVSVSGTENEPPRRYEP
ncbi:MAG TPA: PilZ domain-containing protein [Thermoanaerobaculia bacterium]|nr:PilZ domain-containing protein [Thermoanaerobaculia bacterium]